MTAFRREWSWLKRLLFLSAATGGGGAWETMTGKILTFIATKAKPVRLSFLLKPIQAGSGDPSPENVRAISGHEGATVYRSGINIWDEEWELGTINISTGENADSSSSIRSKNFIKVIPGMRYYFKCPGTVGLRYYSEDKTFIESNSAINQVKTIPSYVGFIRLAMSGYTTYSNDVSINFPSTDTSYHAGDVQTHPATFPSVVYGGEVDWNAGKLKVTHGIVDLGELDWAYNASNFNFRSATALENAKLPSGATRMPSAICSCYPIVTYEYLSEHTDCATIIFSSSGFAGQVWLNDSTYTDPIAFKEAMSGKTICYELATPTEVSLSDLDSIVPVVGANNVWVDNADNILVQYFGVN